MLVPKQPSWEDLDPETQKELEAQFKEELSRVAEPGLTEQGVEAYLAYRRERPTTQITTFEEGRIRQMLHGMRDTSRIPDPVDEEEHIGAIESFGARKLHLTNFGTYTTIVLAHVFVGVLAIILYLILFH